MLLIFPNCSSKLGTSVPSFQRPGIGLGTCPPSFLYWGAQYANAESKYSRLSKERIITRSPVVHHLPYLVLAEAPHNGIPTAYISGAHDAIGDPQAMKWTLNLYFCQANIALQSKFNDNRYRVRTHRFINPIPYIPGLQSDTPQFLGPALIVPYLPDMSTDLLP
ncbi:hypothetical protein Tco_1576165 [Tanacetum coccineum]